MTCSSRVLAALAVLTLCPTASAQDATAMFRFYSSAMRDHMPSVEEAKEFYEAADKSQALAGFIDRWFDDPGHEKRVGRHFNDMFGVQPYFFLVDEAFDLIPYDPASHPEAPADLATAGVYHLRSSVKSSCGAVLTQNAWFSDTPIQICASATSNAVMYNNYVNICTDAFGANGIRSATCGCGPEQILCYPKARKKHAVAGVAREWAERGLRAYADGWSWNELIGTGLFYGDRWLYHHYLHQQKVAVSLTVSAEDLAFLKSLPLDSKTDVALPAGGPERAGVVTMPAFMTRFNNFRSRIRALSNEFLCKDVDGSLNTSGIATFVNGDLSAFDKAHGDDEGCATCHYGMDNQGSTLLGWTADGYYEAWAPKSQAGHVFGADGAGPRFLMEGYATRADGFNECMAKKSWEGFTGASWDSLSAAEKAELTGQAALGPRQAIRGVLTSAAMKKLRADPKTTVTKTVTVTLGFADVAPIIANSCSGSTCHSADNGRPSSVYVDNEANFKNAAAVRISGGSMPPPGSGKSLTSEERNKLLNFLAQ